jgi:hypothetical protein
MGGQLMESTQAFSYTGNIPKPQQWLGIQASGARIFLRLLGRNGKSSLKKRRINGMLLPRYAAHLHSVKFVHISSC